MPEMGPFAIKIFTLNRLIKTTLLLFILGVYTHVFPAPGFSQEQDKVTRQEFIDLIARYNPGNPLLPPNYFNLSSSKRYALTAANLSRKGFKVLNGKPGNALLSQAEFVRAAYAFTGAPTGKSLHDQKIYLKNAGIIKSSDIGLATEVQGEVVQLHKGSAEEIRTELASPIFMHDKIRTGTGAKAKFTLDDGSALTMAEDSIIRITKNIYDPDKDYRQMLIKVFLGAVRFVVTKVTAKGSMFTVVTPTVTAGVRGTEFIVTVAPDGASRIIGIDGSIVTQPIIAEKPAGEKRILGKDQTQAISKTGIAEEITKAAQAMIKSAVKKTTMGKLAKLARTVTKVRAIAAAKNKLMRGRPGKDKEDADDRDEKGGHSGKGGNHDEVETEADRAARDAEDAAEDAAKEAEDAAEEAAKDAEDAAEEAAKDAEDAAKDAAKEAEDAAKNAAKDAERAARDAAREAEDAAKEDSSGSGSGSSGSDD